MLDWETPLPARLAVIVARQHGIADLADLLGAGMARSTVALWARSGRLHRLHRGVYSLVPPGLLSREGHWLAAVRACGAGAVLSHASVAQLAWIVPPEARFATHVSLSDRRRLRSPGIVVHRPVSLPPSDRTSRRGVPTTTLARKVWDLAATESTRTVRRAYERRRAPGASIPDGSGSSSRSAPTTEGPG